AAFIRFQCQYPDWNTSHPQARELMARDGEFDSFKLEWLKELPKLPGVKWWDHRFKRGFVNGATFQSSKAFREHAATVFAASPVDSVVIKRVTDRPVLNVLSSPLLCRLCWLSFDGRLTDEGVRRVAACPSLTRLESLLIWGGGYGDEGAVALAGSPYLCKLQFLSFSQRQIGDRGALALARSPNLSRVTDLVLHGTRGLKDEVVDELKKRFQRLDGTPTRGW